VKVGFEPLFDGIFVIDEGRAPIVGVTVTVLLGAFVLVIRVGRGVRSSGFVGRTVAVSVCGARLSLLGDAVGI
jgi:hypothetical protein